MKRLALLICLIFCAPAHASVLGWGSNKHGELSAVTKGKHGPSTARSPVAAKVPCAATQAVSAYFDSFFLCSNGTVLGVGGNQLGLLGLGYVSKAPVLKPKPLPGLAGVTQIAPQIALAAGVPWVWGGNRYGELGNGTTARGVHVAPQPVALSGIVAIASDAADKLALSAGGNLYGWGENRTGQLGKSKRHTEEAVPSPRLLASHVASAAVGGISSLGSHIVILHADGSTTCQGDDRHKECPARIPLAEVVEASAAIGLTLLRQRDGTVWELGRISGQTYSTPHRVLTGASQLSAGFGYALALVAGNVEAWGSNRFGAIGDGTKAEKPVPVSVLSGASAVVAGEYHSLSLR